MAKIMDVCLLSSEKAVGIDADGSIVLTSKEPTFLLSASEGQKLQEFLARNENLLAAACGGEPLGSSIRMWKPEEVKSRMDHVHARRVWPTMMRRPGWMFICGRLAGEDTFYHGGFSADQQRFVLVPDRLLNVGFREILVQLVAEGLSPEQRTNVLTLATRVAAEELRDDPASNDFGSGLFWQAQENTGNLTYWIALAGPDPIPDDPHDLRHPNRRAN